MSTGDIIVYSLICSIQFLMIIGLTCTHKMKCLNEITQEQIERELAKGEELEKKEDFETIQTQKEHLIQ